MELVYTQQPGHLGQDHHVDAVDCTPSEGGVAGPVGVEDQFEARVPHGLEAAPPCGEDVDHHIPATMILQVLGAALHLTPLGRYVGHVHLPLPGLGLGPVPGLQGLDHTVLKGIEPLATQVLVILHHVAASAPSLVRHLSVVRGIETQLGLDDGTHQGPFLNTGDLPDALDPVHWPLEALHQLLGEDNVVEPEVPNVLQAEDVAGDAAEDVGHVPRLEKLYGVSDFNHFTLDPVDLGGHTRHVGLLGAQLGPGADAALSRDASGYDVEGLLQRLQVEPTQ